MKHSNHLKDAEEEIILTMLYRGWVSSVGVDGRDMTVLWTPDGAHRAMTIIMLLDKFSVRTLSDLAQFDRACRGWAPALETFKVGPASRKFWNDCCDNLELGDDIGMLRALISLILDSSHLR